MCINVYLFVHIESVFFNKIVIMYYACLFIFIEIEIYDIFLYDQSITFIGKWVPEFVRDLNERCEEIVHKCIRCFV